MNLPKFLFAGTAALAVVLSTHAQSFLTNGLVAYYPFNGNANDASGNGNNGTNNGAIYTTNRFGVPASAVSFNGTSTNFISTFYTPPSGTSARSFSLWFNTSSTAQDGNTYSTSGDMLSYGAYNMYPGDRIDIGIQSGGGVYLGSSFSGVTTTSMWNDGKWHQCLVLIPTNSILSQIELYIDGVLQPVTYYNYATINTATNVPLNFGRMVNGHYSYSGALSDVRIYNRTLTSNEVSQLYAYEFAMQPAIFTNPADFYAQANQPASFSVTATGMGTPAYQWQFNGTNLLNATNSTFYIPAVKQINLGQYDVIITNAYGSITSSVANLYMYPFLSQPFAGVDTYWGQTNTLNVGAWGSGILSYQWYFNGIALSGATNSTLPLGAIQFTNAGQYNVVVSSSLGSVTNAAYSVVVNPANVSLATTPTVVIQGTVGYNYIVQSTTNLADTNSWVTETNLTLTQPIQDWYDANVDTSKPGHPQKFYQVLPGQ